MAERYLAAMHFRGLTRLYDPFIRLAMAEGCFKRDVSQSEAGTSRSLWTVSSLGIASRPGGSRLVDVDLDLTEDLGAGHDKDRLMGDVQQAVGHTSQQQTDNRRLAPGAYDDQVG